MVNNKVRTILKVIFPLIFISYFCSVTFFTHSHIVNGVTIVHSHPYQKGTNGNPTHEHPEVEIQLIELLSTYFYLGLIILSFVLALFLITDTKLSDKLYIFFLQDYGRGSPTLRPPPFYGFKY